MPDKYANVAVKNRTAPSDGLFTYVIPDKLAPVRVGQIVTVPFGRYRTFGVVISTTSRKPDFKTRAIVRAIPDIIIPAHLLKLAQHIADYYYCSLGQALFAMVPGFITKKVSAKTVKVIKIAPNYPDPEALKKYPKQWELWQYMIHNPEAKWPDIQDRLSSSSLKSLVRKKYLLEERVDVNRPINLPDRSHQSLPDLLPNQDKIWQKINEYIATPGQAPILLFGRTGSGKTEIYLRAAQEVIKRGQSAIILVPEIALVPQTIARFYEIFGSQMAVYHSQLSEGERRDQWHRIYTGDARVVIGSRSAIFTPVKKPGLIIIDEEHEYSYKQDSTPRYHAVDVAAEYSRITGANLIIGSATPRVESFWRAKKKEYKLFKLSKTVRELLNPQAVRRPRFVLADLRQEYANKNLSTISLPLHVAIQNTLERRRQIMLFLNRRGYTSYVFCRLCGYVAKCPSCSVSLTFHLNQNQGNLICHHCGYQVPNPTQCPSCHSPSIKYYGAGTQKVEQDIKELFPSAKIIRMDHDTTRTKHAHQSIFERFRRHEADILIGTQMIAKGWNIPNADLIGIINADAGWHLPDFRATEKNFALMLQIIGRVGRFDSAGEVVVQTYEPDNPLFDVLRKEAYQLFAFSELIERKRHNFPPFTNLVRLIYEHASADRCKQRGIELFSQLNHAANQTKPREITDILGPAPAFFSKINNKYRWHIILKGKNLQRYLNLVPADWIIDVDPFSLL